MGRAHVEVQGGLPAMEGIPPWQRGSQASLAAHGEDQDEADCPLQLIEDKDVYHINGGL